MMTTYEKLEAIASNLWWSWHPEAIKLFEELDPDHFSDHRAPVQSLSNPDPGVLDNTSFAARVDATHAALQRHLVATAEYESAPHVAYFCMEFGLHESLPFYAGGLGILAGDHTKAASSLGIPFTAVGLFLKNGYFKQTFDGSGYQQDANPELDVSNHPITPVVDAEGQPLTVSVHLGDISLQLAAHRLKVGRSSLILLDSDLEENPEHLRELTTRLYCGDLRTRIQQEIILGIGGVRMLRAMDVQPDLYHMNEGHSAFLTLELMREQLDAGMSSEDAQATIRKRCVFTTHTPVVAGHDRFSPALFHEQMEGFIDRIGLPENDVLKLGQLHRGHDPDDPFVMTVLGLTLARDANGVSKLNGEVARRQWTELYPQKPEEETPIGSVTNGIHLPTWTAVEARTFLNEHLGDWMEHLRDPSFWHQIHEVNAADLWGLRNRLRESLIDFVEKRAPCQSIKQEVDLREDALTIGFARRFATYKRATLFFMDEERAAAFFNDNDRPIQMIFAGKAHPHDEGGKALIQRLYDLSQREPFRGHLIFLEDYDMQIGRQLISGCDVWLNNPRQPFEASGTSGQKIAVHGGLNCSILDGWWPEGYSGKNGWSFGDQPLTSLEHGEEQDQKDAESLYQTMDAEVLPAFYSRNEAGIPERWISAIKHAMADLSPKFSAERMVADYIEQIYQTTGR